MAKGDEITTRFKVDISDLKKGITEANKQIQLADAKFKAATAGMDDWRKSSEGVEAKLKNLNSVLEAQKSKLNIYVEELNRQQTAYDKNTEKIETLKAKLAELASQGVDKASEAYKNYENALATCEKEQGKNEEAIDRLSGVIALQEEKINGVQGEIGKYESKLGDLKQAQQEAAESAEKQGGAYDTLKSTINEQQSRLDELKKKYSDVVLEQGKNSDSAKELAGEIDSLSSELNENKTQLNEADKAADELDNSLEDTKKSAEDAGDGFTVMKGVLVNLATQGISMAIEALKNLATAAYESWQSFDDGADTITAATGATGEAADDLAQVYNNLTKSVLGDFETIGTAIGEVNTRFGLTGDQLEETSEKFLKFAEINGVDVKTAIDNTQSAMAAWGVESEKTTNMIDLLNKAGQDTGVSVDELASSLVSNGPALQEMGYNVSDAAMFLANLSKNGVDASSVMSGMKKALANAASEGKPMSEAMANIEDAIKNAKDSTEAITTATELFGSKAGPAIATAVRDGKLSFEELGTSLEDFSGNIDETYENMLDLPDKMALAMQGATATLAQLFDYALSSNNDTLETAVSDFESTVIPKIQELMPEFQSVLTNLTQLFRDVVPEMLNALYESISENIAPMAAQATELVLALVTALIEALPLLTNAGVEIIGGILTGIGQALPDVTTTIVEVIPQIVQGLVNGLPDLINGAVTLLMGIVEAIPEVISALMEAIPQIIDAIVEALVVGIPALIDGAIELFMAIVDAIPEIIPIIVENLPTIISSVVDGLITGFDAILNGAIELFMAIIDAIPVIIEELIPELPSIVTTIVSVLIENIPILLEGAIQLFMALVEAIPTIIDALIQELPKIVDTFLTSLSEPLEGIFGDLWTNISEWGSEAWNKVEEIWSVVSTWFDENVIQPVKNFFSELWDKISTAAKDAWNKVKEVWSVVKNWFNKNLIEPVSNFFSTMWNKLTTGAKDAWQGIKDVFGKVKDWFKDKFSEAWTAVKNVFSTGGKIFDGIKEGITAAFKNVVNAIIRGINKVIAFPFNTINDILDKIRNFEILGLSPFSSIGSISVPQIPELMQGGILKRGQMGLLEGNGAEAVVPLDKNKKWIKAVATDLLEELGSIANIGGSVNSTKDYNFTQIINAPKQPSRIELYRQTRNLLAYASATGGD